MANRFDLIEIDPPAAPSPAQAPQAPAARPVGFALPKAAAVLQAAAASLASAQPQPQAPAGLAAQPQAPAQLAGEGAGRAGAIDTEGRARAIASDELASKFGIVGREPTLYAWGTRGQWGGAAAKSRAELAARPLVPELAAQVKAQVAGEARRADAGGLPSLRYGADDRLRTVQNAGGDGVAVTAHAFRQLLNRADAPGYAAGYLGSDRLDGKLRAPHVQHWLDAAFLPPQEQGAAPSPIQGVLLSKLHNGGARHVYGVVSPDYARHDMDAVIRDIVGAVPSTARGALKYDAATTRWSADVSIGLEFEPVVGDIHRVTLRVKGHDAGGGSILVQLLAERVRCLNFSQVRLEGKLSRVRHVGSSVADKVRALLSIQGEALNGFAAAWREANEAAIVDGGLSGDGDARDVFRALIAKGYVEAPEGEAVAVERYFSAWLKEPGHNRSDFVNAITRAAHEAPWSSPWASETLEEQAGELLYNRVVLSRDAFDSVRS
jgi:hypothetical protein